MTLPEAIKEVEKHTNETVFYTVELGRHVHQGQRSTITKFKVMVWSGDEYEQFSELSFQAAVEQAVAWLKAKKVPASTTEEVEQAFADAGASEEETARGEIATGEAT